MDHDIAHELGFLLGEHNAGRVDLTKDAAVGGCLRNPKRKPKGRGIGRVTAMKYGWKPPETKQGAEEVEVERFVKSKDDDPQTKEAIWGQLAMMAGSMALPYVIDWATQKWGGGQQQQQQQQGQQQAGGYGAGGYGGGAYGGQPQQQSYFGFKPTSTRQVAQPAYQFGERMASTATSGLVKRAADGLTALALIKIAEQFTFPEGGAYPGKPIQLAPNLLHGGAMEPGRTYVPDTAPASQIGFAPQSRRHGASEAAQQLGWAFSDPTMLGAAAAGAGGAGATAGGGGGGTTAAGGGGGGGTTAAAAGGGAAAKGGLGGKPSTRALRARYARGVQRYGLEGFAQRRGMNPEEIGRVVGRRGMARLQSGKNVGRFGIPKTTLGGWRPGSKVAWGGLSALGKLGRVGKWGGLAALGGLGVYGLGNLMGWWGRDKKTTPEAGGKGVSIYSPEERRQFARIGVDPRQAMAAQSAAGALQAGGAFRRAQHQNWLRAANAMMLTGMPDQFNKVPARYAQ